MHSRLLADLDRRMRSSADDVGWARDMCRAALHLGRQGRDDLATQAIGHVRAHYGHELEPEVACWLMLAEGVLHFYALRYPQARDRAQRAHAIAAALNVVRARPSCAAWMAVIEFDDNRFAPMIERLDEALGLARADDHQARARAALVLADAIHYSGDFARARRWYDQVRHHAGAEGDQGTLSAMLHNTAAFRASHIRLAEAFAPAEMPAGAKLSLIEANSAWAYDTAIGTRSFQTLIPLMQGHMLAVHQRFDAAQRMLEPIDPAQMPAKHRAARLADLAWCDARLGRPDAARARSSQAHEQLGLADEPDEQAFVLARLAAIEQVLGVQWFDNARVRAEAALEAHRAMQRALAEQLRALEARLDARAAAAAVGR